MSDTSQAAGWWMANDGKWYPPDITRLPPPPPGRPAASGPQHQLTSVSSSTFSPGACVMIGAGALVLIGSLLPWATASAAFVGTLSKAGTAGDGVFTLILAICLIGLGLASFRPNRSRLALPIIGIVLAVIAVVICVADMGTLPSSTRDVIVSVGTGLWLCLIGSAAAAAGSIAATVASSRPQ